MSPSGRLSLDVNVRAPRGTTVDAGVTGGMGNSLFSPLGDDGDAAEMGRPSFGGLFWLIELDVSARWFTKAEWPADRSARGSVVGYLATSERVIVVEPSADNLEVHSETAIG